MGAAAVLVVFMVFLVSFTETIIAQLCYDVNTSVPLLWESGTTPVKWRDAAAASAAVRGGDTEKGETMPFNGIVLPGLKAARLRKALTQEELAEASGIGRTTLARLETGAPAAPGSARKLARALGVEPDALMGPATPLGE